MVTKPTADFYSQTPWFVLGVCVITTIAPGLFAGGDPGQTAPPAPAQGTVSPSGKFTPAPPGPNSNPALATPRSQAEAEFERILNIQQTGPDTYRAGRIEFDKKQRIISLPARINSRTQILEYALVTTSGKTHEALLSTDVRPVELHLAFLLLGAVPSEVGGSLNQAATIVMSNSVSIEVTWETNGAAISHPLAELIVLKGSGSATDMRSLAPGDWLYNGSIFDPFGFAAQREGSFVSLIRDPVALINNPRSDRDNDQNHVPNEKLVPPEGWPVRVIFRLPGGVAGSPSPARGPGWTPITPLSTNAPPER